MESISPILAITDDFYQLSIRFFHFSMILSQIFQRIQTIPGINIENEFLSVENSTFSFKRLGE